MDDKEPSQMSVPVEGDELLTADQRAGFAALLAELLPLAAIPNLRFVERVAIVPDGQLAARVNGLIVEGYIPSERMQPLPSQKQQNPKVVLSAGTVILGRGAVDPFPDPAVRPFPRGRSGSNRADVGVARRPPGLEPSRR